MCKQEANAGEGEEGQSEEAVSQGEQSSSHNSAEAQQESNSSQPQYQDGDIIDIGGGIYFFPGCIGHSYVLWFTAMHSVRFFGLLLSDTEILHIFSCLV